MNSFNRKNIQELPREIQLRALTLKKNSGLMQAIRFLTLEQKVGLRDAKIFLESHDEFGRYNPDYRKKFTPSLLKNIFFLVGILLLIIAFMIYFFQVKFIEKSVRVQATVIGLSASGDGYTPIFNFIHEDQSYSVVPNFSSNPPAFVEGEQVNLYIDPLNPYDILVDSFLGRYLVIMILSGIGVVFSMIGWLVYFAFGRQEVNLFNQMGNRSL